MSEWQTIDSAPRDGTVILIKRDDGRPAAAASWLDDGDGFPWKVFDGTTEVDGWSFGRPSHWQPLPT